MTREEALKIVRNSYQTDKEKEALETLIPELKESEDEKIRKFIYDYIARSYWKKDWNVGQKECLAWLEKQKGPEKDAETRWENGTLVVDCSKQKPAEWSEEDSDNLERIDNYLWMLDDYVGDDCTIPQGKTDKIRGNIQEVLSPWLKSLPERFNLQPKQEWSEKDERILKGIIGKIDHDQTYGVSKLEMLSLLCRIRPSWKPSEEQMKALLNAEGFLRAGLQHDSAKTIAELYEQIKRLM